MTARARFLSSNVHAAPAEIRHEVIDVPDTRELISQFQRATDIIDQHYFSSLPPGVQASMNQPLDGRLLNHFCRQWKATYPNKPLPQGGSTLIFCESGNEQSAVVAAAYVMQFLDGNAIQAIQMVQSRRFCVCYNDSTKWMLANYEPIWTARRQSRIQQSSGTTSQRTGQQLNGYNMYNRSNGYENEGKSRLLKRRLDQCGDDDSQEEAMDGFGGSGGPEGNGEEDRILGRPPFLDIATPNPTVSFNGDVEML
jgi:serine/threonine/tyrosine-interacting protein